MAAPTKAPEIKTTAPVVPMIYAYSTPQIADHDGWVKIGYTETQTTGKRQKQQAHTVDVKVVEQWKGRAVYEDETGETFTDGDFHRYLKKLGIERKPGTEWFHVSGSESRDHFYDFRSNRGLIESDDVSSYTLRHEQKEAVEQTAAYANDHAKGSFLWNAKPRFGKTLSAYDLVQRLGAVNVLIVTNRPAIANSWYADYERFLGTPSGYLFISDTDALKDKPLVYTREQYSKLPVDDREDLKGVIEFVSLQDLKGEKLFGGRQDKHNRLDHIADINWDILIIDEAHEGVDTYKTDVAFDRIRRKFTLHLSGTPFKALANDKFEEAAIYNWTYADEQNAKRAAEGSDANPYATLPQLNLYTYKMSDIVAAEVQQGMEIDGETVEYAFDLDEFFRVKGEKFVHEEAVDRFLSALTEQKKFPFSTEELRDELRHTFWLLRHVDSAKALAKKLKAHPVFQDYEIVLAAGDGRLDDTEETEKSFDKVRRAIRTHDKTITLSVGQLTTGVTIPEWTAVMMLSNMKSPSLYMQAAFRAQNPHLFYRGKGSDGKDIYLRKENAYVFDFDPARTLTIFEQFANDLASETSDGRGSTDQRKQNVRELLNFFPVVGEDEDGEMILLDAEKVLSIPRKIRSQEVVKRGFMSDFLFQNIANVFRAPQEVLEILGRIEPVKAPKKSVNIDEETADRLDLDENGEVDPSSEKVVGTAKEVFGDKLYSVSDSDIEQAVSEASNDPEVKKGLRSEDPRVKKVKEMLGTGMGNLEERAKEHYGRELPKRDRERWKRRNLVAAEREAEKTLANDRIDRMQIEDNLEKELKTAVSEAAKQAAQQQAAEKHKELDQRLARQLKTIQDESLETAKKDLARTIIVNKDQQEVDKIQASIRDHLRGFSRSIPSFIMAYGDDKLTLANFDTYVEPEVFEAVTDITIDDFHLLRDGRSEEQARAEGKQPYAGHLFDEVVFDDSIQEFLRIKERLKDYFQEGQTEDIFSYVPPQKTNQIFTPRRVVEQMVDALEQENPGCFDNPDATFADLYMKSGLYITEIVKRLFRSAKMKELFPDDKERIRHILRKQVYGMAPTRILYLITTNYILGFDPELLAEHAHFAEEDTAAAAKEGRLQEVVDKHFGNGE